ncbi:hypothetical protein NN561_009552 [Cricetulus griseus]
MSPSPFDSKKDGNLPEEKEPVCQLSEFSVPSVYVQKLWMSRVPEGRPPGVRSCQLRLARKPTPPGQKDVPEETRPRHPAWVTPSPRPAVQTDAVIDNSLRHAFPLARASTPRWQTPNEEGPESASE